jgi:hypothetical protein
LKRYVLREGEDVFLEVVERSVVIEGTDESRIRLG